MRQHVILRATNPLLNMDRVYEIWLDRGLFNKWTVLIAHGPFKGGLTQRTYVFESKTDAQGFIEKLIKQKCNSKKRIGEDYKVIYER